MSDLIRVVDLEVWSRIGVSEVERADPQLLLVSLEMRVKSFAEAAQSDDVADTIDYFNVAQRVQAIGAENTVHLLETMAERIAGKILEEFPVVSLKVEIKKFVIREAKWVSVEIERTPSS